MLFLKRLLGIFLSGVIAILFLSIFCYFYNYTGVNVKNDNGSTDYTAEKNTLLTNLNEGYAYIITDANGYTNKKTFDSIDILLMGSSHMEARQISIDYNVASLLNDEMSNYNTYNIGVSGHTIYRCVDNIQDAIRCYSPNKYIIIETSTIKLDIEEMNDVINNTSTKIATHDSRLIYYLQKLPCIKPIFKQVEKWIDNSKTTDTNNSQDVKDDITEEYKNILNSFLKIVSDSSSDVSVKPIIFFHPTEELNADGSVDYLYDKEYLQIYEETCNNLGIVFINMEESFQSMYNEKHVLAHGFSNTEVGVGHLNKYGHEAIANKLIEIIRKMDEE